MYGYRKSDRPLDYTPLQRATPWAVRHEGVLVALVALVTVMACVVVAS